MIASQHSRLRHRRQGFTLIELVAALVLLSVLMVALTGLIPRFTDRQDDAAATARAALQHTARILLDRLAGDLSAAESATLANTTLTVRGTVSPAAAPAASGMIDDVRYAVEQRANRHCLFRTQHGQTDLLCCGEFRLDIRSFADDGTVVELVALDASAAHAGTAEDEERR
jgi:prepilin-type N-terminal cleavage/methylation domain-containing protein